MNPLDEAWQWYLSSKEQHSLLGRIARKYWEGLPWDGPLGRDDRLKDVDDAQLVKRFLEGIFRAIEILLGLLQTDERGPVRLLE